MLMRCPDCDKRLEVPDGKAGHRARCSACRSTFIIPNPDAEMEDTIAGWMVEDLEQVMEMKARHEALYRRLDPKAPAKAAPR